MKDLANNLDIKGYSQEISKITGISVILIQKIIMYAILTSTEPWYYTFETIIDNLLATSNQEVITNESRLMAI